MDDNCLDKVRAQVETASRQELEKMCIQLLDYFGQIVWDYHVMALNRLIWQNLLRAPLN